jgi:hypothetical protein
VSTAALVGSHSQEFIDVNMNLSGTPEEPINDRYEETKGDYDDHSHKKKNKKHRDPEEVEQTPEHNEEEELVNEIDTFLIEDDDL